MCPAQFSSSERLWVLRQEKIGSVTGTIEKLNHAARVLKSAFGDRFLYHIVAPGVDSAAFVLSGAEHPVLLVARDTTRQYYSSCFQPAIEILSLEHQSSLKNKPPRTPVHGPLLRLPSDQLARNGSYSHLGFPSPPSSLFRALLLYLKARHTRVLFLWCVSA
jgi:hypothetical protein